METTERGVCVGVIEDVECLGGGDDQLERIGVLVDHDDGERVVGGAPEQEDVDPVRRAIRELSAGGSVVIAGMSGSFVRVG